MLYIPKHGIICKVKAKAIHWKGGRGGVMGIRTPQGGAMCGLVPINLVPKGLIKIVMFFLRKFLAIPNKYLPNITRKNWYWAFWKTKWLPLKAFHFIFETLINVKAHIMFCKLPYNYIIKKTFKFFRCGQC